MTDYISKNALKVAFEEDGHLSAYIEETIDSCPTFTMHRAEKPYDDLAKCLEDAAGWSGEDYGKNAEYISCILRQAAQSVAELLCKVHIAGERLCECCGVCREEQRDPLDCEIANLAPPDVPMEYLEAGGTL